MGTISVSLPSDGSTADVADYNTPITTVVNAINGNLDNANVATGAAIDGAKIASSSLTSSQMATSISPVTRWSEGADDFVASGCVWSGDSYGSTLAASMTSGVVYISGKRLTVAAVTARAFTASKDTYIDLSDNGDGTAAFTYTEVGNNAASPVLAASSVRIAIIVSGGSSIAASTSIAQGGFANTSPTISSQILKGFDTLGNLIYPKGPSSPAKTQNSVNFMVYRTAALTSTNSAGGAAILYDTKSFDSGNNVDVTTNKGRFTAPVAGFYFFIGTVGNGTAGGGGQAYLNKNGTAVRYGVSTVGDGTVGRVTQVTGVIPLAANDYVEVYYQGGGGSTIIVGENACNFSGFLLSAS